MEDFKKLKFNNILSMIDVSMWYEIEKKKINEWKLEEKPINIVGKIEHPYNLEYSKKHNSCNIIQLSSESFIDENKTNLKSLNIHFDFMNYNMEKNLIENSPKILNLQKDKLLDKIKNYNFGSLFYGILYTHANLKSHIFKYLIDYPIISLDSSLFIKNKKSGDEIGSLLNITYDDFIKENNICNLEPFIINLKNKKILKISRDIFQNLSGGNNLSDNNNFSNNNYVICMLDLSCTNNIGLHWKNLLTAIRIINPNITNINLLSIRDSWKNSIYFSCLCDKLTDKKINSIEVIGINDNKIKIVNLSNNMDPIKIMESSSKLNLSLMKWRMSPNLKLDELSQSKVLLLGSGTLGCNIARHLLMWGVNNITFVDRGTVSYSNPVRQTLFEFSDCLKDQKSKVKSLVAADSIKRILPTCNCNGIEMTIHMPGHRIDDNKKEEAIEEIKNLENLIKEHDVTFLLTDTRESRWLPTLLASVHEKPIINVALGFDTFVVMRHGLKKQNEKRMGCYFCNDVVAPVDSLSGRTLDQQCTITRPGVSSMASSIAVEILASVYNHPEKFLCLHNDDNIPETDIGIIPQQIRGEINGYSNITMFGYYYDKCVACSDTMVNKFKEEGYEFIVSCINETKYIEKVSCINNYDNLNMDDIVEFD